MEIHTTEVPVLKKNSKIINKLNTHASFSQETLLQARYTLSTHPCVFLWHS